MDAWSSAPDACSGRACATSACVEGGWSVIGCRENVRRVLKWCTVRGCCSGERRGSRRSMESPCWDISHHTSAADKRGELGLRARVSNEGDRSSGWRGKVRVMAPGLGGGRLVCQAVVQVERTLMGLSSCFLVAKAAGLLACPGPGIVPVRGSFLASGNSSTRSSVFSTLPWMWSQGWPN